MGVAGLLACCPALGVCARAGPAEHVEGTGGSGALWDLHLTRENTAGPGPSGAQMLECVPVMCGVCTRVCMGVSGFGAGLRPPRTRAPACRVARAGGRGPRMGVGCPGEHRAALGARSPEQVLSAPRVQVSGVLPCSAA